MLTNGALPLDVLETEIDRWIASRQSRSRSVTPALLTSSEASGLEDLLGGFGDEAASD